MQVSCKVFILFITAVILWVVIAVNMDTSLVAPLMLDIIYLGPGLYK